MFHGYEDLQSLRCAAIIAAQKRMNGEAVCLDNLKKYAEYKTFEDLVDALVMDTEYWNRVPGDCIVDVFGTEWPNDDKERFGSDHGVGSVDPD